MILIIAGRGGHLEQANRLKDGLNKVEKTSFVLLTENNVNQDLSDYTCVYYTDELRNKESWSISILNMPRVVALQFFSILKILHEQKINVVVTTGPGLTIIPSIVCRLAGKKVVYIETWSRFYSLSLTGKIMKRIAPVFLVQNKSLLNVYKRAVYAGRL